MPSATPQAATHAAVSALVCSIAEPCAIGRYELIQLKAKALEEACRAESLSAGFALQAQSFADDRSIETLSRSIEATESRPSDTTHSRALRLSVVAWMAAHVQSRCIDLIDFSS